MSPRPVSTQVDLTFKIDDATSYIIDIPRALSLINRKSFRSGYVYSVAYLEYIGNEGDLISVVKIPEGYVTNAAYTNGFNIWKKQRHDAMEVDGVSPGKWSDFKPWMNYDHLDGDHEELLPQGMSASGLVNQDLDTTGSEWNRAEIIENDAGAATTTTWYVGMLGADNTLDKYGGLIQAWGDTRAGTMAPDPNIPATLSSSWISHTGEESSEMATDVLNLVESENDHPPYANITDPVATASYVGGSESAPGGVLHDQGLAGSTGRAVILQGGFFPLGLLQINVGGPGNALFRIHLTRGDYKGVAAAKIGDFR